MGDMADYALDQIADSDEHDFEEECDTCGGGPGWHFAGCPELG